MVMQMPPSELLYMAFSDAASFGLVISYEKNMSEPLTLTFTQREKEYVAATRLFYARVHHTRFLIIFSSIVVCLGLVLFLMNLDLLLATVTTVVSLILLVNNFYTYFVGPGQHFRRNAKFQQEYCLRISEDGLLFNSKNIQSKLEWGLYSKVWETPNFYYLFYDKDLFTLIPKRVFTSKQQEWTFQNLLKRKIPANNFETRKPFPQPENDFTADQIPPPRPPDWR